MKAIKNFTPLQWLGIIVLFNGMIIGGTSQLTTLVGAGVTDKLVALAALGNMFLGGLVTMFSGQGAQVHNVLDMKGVEHLAVNAQANPTLAAIAVDPTVAKIAPTPAALDVVTETAKAA